MLSHKNINIIEFKLNKNSIILMAKKNVPEWIKKLRKKFDNKKFQQEFQVESDNEYEDTLKESDLLLDKINKPGKLYPHQKPIEDILVDVRGIFFEITDNISNKTNPIPHILNNDKKKFATSILLIMFGTIFLLISTLMRSK